jgi:hexosaminidase
MLYNTLKTIFTFILLSTIVVHSQAQYPYSILPKPVSLAKTRYDGGIPFVLRSSTRIKAPEKYADQTAYFVDAIRDQTGIEFTGELVKPRNVIIVSESPEKITKPEMYTITTSQEILRIEINDKRGYINAIQTVLQLLPLEKVETASIETIAITDYPRFSYRGMHLDVVRHIFPVAYIKKYIDYLTFHKLNNFHWHLTDDQGWRIEMKSYPKLNTIGSFRDATLIGHFKDTPAKYDSTRYGGYYTRAEITEIVAYANVRGINIIPEIDIPGHSRAAIAAYPELSTKPDTSWNVATTWGMYNRQNNVLAPKPATFQFLETVFTELMELFPSTYIHIGGDECSKLWWKQDPNTQQFMQQNNLKNETALQTYFIEYVARFLQKNNRIAIGWHEINEGDIDTSTIVMNWGTEKQAIEAAKKGFRVIQTPGKPFYFDHYQSADPSDSLSIHGYNPLEAIYNFEPIPAAISNAGLGDKVVGGQANVWTEYMGNEKKVDYMIFPRMTALSETLWSKPADKSYKNFLKRLEKQMIPRYQFWNSSYFPAYKKWGVQQTPVTK